MASRALHLASWLPYPAEGGGQIVCWNFARCLRHNGYQTDLLCIHKTHHVSDTDLAAVKEVYRDVEVVKKRTDHQHPRDLLHALATGTSYFAKKYTFRAFEDALRRQLECNRYDVTLVETAYMALYLPILTRYEDRVGRIIVRLQNVEHELFERLAANEPNPLYRWLLGREARLFRHHEVALIRSDVDVRAITARDAAVLASAAGTMPTVLDPHIDVDEFPSGQPHEIEPHNLLFVGNLLWPPNHNAMVWFCKRVWPEVRRAFPHAHLTIVGNCPPRSAQRLAGARISLTGHVPDVRPYVRRAHLFIAPLLDGSGVRVKILMALCMGKTVLSTPMGAEGIDYPGMCIETSAAGWIAATTTALRRAPLIDQRAIDFVRARYDWRRSFAALR